MSEINFITKPEFYMISTPNVNWNEFNRFTDFIEAESGGNKAIKLRDMATNTDRHDADTISELAGRICYQSYFKGRDQNSYIDHILEDAHGNVLEHPFFNTIVTGISRALTHELIRHRVGTAISEMSQRFVGGNEKSSKWNFVVPSAMRDHMDDPKVVEMLTKSAESDIRSYENAVEYLEGVIPLGADHRRKQIFETARQFLPNMSETRIFWSFNLRQVRHILDKRGSEFADREIREFCQALLSKLEEERIYSMQDVKQEKDGTIEMMYRGV